MMKTKQITPANADKRIRQLYETAFPLKASVSSGVISRLLNLVVAILLDFFPLLSKPFGFK